ncbi:MAG: alpha/beta hydrolase fold protein [Marmoricola sp.]|jgi:pimeloyl-ACP methyl ester carboxylesterase|nr:alpha/beta hydrolase fold protein [Marmoricola sp.]
MSEVAAPRLEGTAAVRNGRVLSFAEFGAPGGAPIIWMHGTPGARRQIPVEARLYAEQHDIRLIGIDRPGIGTSTQHLYRNVFDWVGDLALFADVLEAETFRIIGLSGGGPYALAAGAGLPGRVKGVGVLGGVAPRKGPDAIGGGATALTPYLAPILSCTRVPLGFALAQGIRIIRPLAGPALDAYAAVQPKGDKEILARPEFRAMFLDDLLNGARFQVSAPLADVVLFTRPWGFEASEVTVPVVWWHGDKDHIIPHRHGEHMVERLPEAELRTVPGESHLGTMGFAEEILETLMSLGG